MPMVRLRPIPATFTDLDPLNPQTKYAPALLELFQVLLESPDYVERLKRHYRMFRDSVEKGQNQQAGLNEVRRLENKRKHLRDPTVAAAAGDH